MKKIKYLVFTRQKFNISPKMQYELEIYEIENKQILFIEFIEKLVRFSKKYNSYINVYKIEDFSPYLNKIAWIKQGDLYTL